MTRQSHINISFFFYFVCVQGCLFHLQISAKFVGFMSKVSLWEDFSTRLWPSLKFWPTVFLTLIPLINLSTGQLERTERNDVSHPGSRQWVSASVPTAAEHRLSPGWATAVYRPVCLCAGERVHQLWASGSALRSGRLLRADGWVTGAAAAPQASPPQARRSQGGPRHRLQPLHLRLLHREDPVRRLRPDADAQVGRRAWGDAFPLLFWCMAACMQEKHVRLPRPRHLTSSPSLSFSLPAKSMVRSKSMYNGYVPAVAKVTTAHGQATSREWQCPVAAHPRTLVCTADQSAEVSQKNYSFVSHLSG